MADKELERVRAKFVEKAQKELIQQILDDLLQDGVLNDGQKDSVLEENSAKADKARSLIDMVKKKGDAASRQMIASIYRRDLMLYTELGLTYVQPPQQAAEPQKKQEGSTKLIHTTEEFWTQKHNYSDVYPAPKNSIRNRVALLITNIKFSDVRMNRNGAERDEENMRRLLTALGYEVVKYTNLTGKQINDAVIQFSKHPKLGMTDSVVVVIMSHGKLGAVLGVNWRNETSDDEFPIDNIFKHLSTEKCPALENKPKIIIIQACRGVEPGSVIVQDGADQAMACDDASQPGDSGEIEDDTLRVVHKEKDFISLLSCTPDTVSYRQTVQGSFLIQYIVDVFNTFAHTDDIEKLFKTVMRRFEDFCVQHRRQMPTKERCTLLKDFFFFPGI